MKSIKKNIPNLITICNLICGLLAIVLAFQGNLIAASSLIFLGAFLDFFDGLAARLLKVSSSIGKQLDSMADIVTFGVAPGFVLFNFMFYLKNGIILRHSMLNSYFFSTEYLALLIPVFSAYRLAKYNIDSRQIDSFIGLPTPALAIFFAAIPHVDFNQFPMFADLKLISILAVIMPLLLIIEMPLFSFKLNKHISINSRLNLFRAILIISSIISFFVFGFVAIVFIVILYLILSLINNILSL